MAHFVTCSRCCKQVSNPTGVEMIVRAWVECPECIEKDHVENAASYEELVAALAEVTRIAADGFVLAPVELERAVALLSRVKGAKP